MILSTTSASVRIQRDDRRKEKSQIQEADLDPLRDFALFRELMKPKG